MLLQCGSMAGRQQKNPIKGLKKFGVWRRKWLVELLGSGPPVGAGVATAFTLSVPSGTWFNVILGCSAWLGAASFLKVWQAWGEDKQEIQANEHSGVAACLHVLHATVLRTAMMESPNRDAADFDLRATFHRVVEPLNDPTQLEQLVDYVGSGGGGRGRLLNVQSGITGQAVRENAVFVMDREAANEAEYRQELVSEWHFRRSEADKLRADRFSAIAIPVTSQRDTDLVLGVVYIDSKMQNLFNGARMQECAVTCCQGISRFIGEHYD